MDGPGGDGRPGCGKIVDPGASVPTVIAAFGENLARDGAGIGGRLIPEAQGTSGGNILGIRGRPIEAQRYLLSCEGWNDRLERTGGTRRGIGGIAIPLRDHPGHGCPRSPALGVGGKGIGSLQSGHADRYGACAGLGGRRRRGAGNGRGDRNGLSESNGWCQGFGVSLGRGIGGNGRKGISG